VSWSRTLKIRQVLRAQIEAGEHVSLLFSDLRGFSAFTASRGDRAAYRLAQLHEGILRARINEYGIVVKSLGDGVMAAFQQPVDAIGAAVGIQRAVRERNREAADEPIDVGIGIASGTPVMTDIDFIGHSVNLAQRLSALAKGGQILVTDEICTGTSLPSELRFTPLGLRSFRGIGLERIAEVTWLREVARVSDARDRLTLILTEGASVMVELAKDPKKEILEALTVLRSARTEQDGLASALLQRAAGWLIGRILRRSVEASELARELELDRIKWGFRRGRLVIQTPGGRIALSGTRRSDAERFVQEMERLRANSQDRVRNGESSNSASSPS
jgi:class 3 adenylate cyclase